MTAFFQKHPIAKLYVIFGSLSFGFAYALVVYFGWRSVEYSQVQGAQHERTRSMQRQLSLAMLFQVSGWGSGASHRHEQKCAKFNNLWVKYEAISLLHWFSSLTSITIRKPHITSI